MATALLCITGVLAGLIRAAYSCAGILLMTPVRASSWERSIEADNDPTLA
ncbi:hypothetical protein [Prochlorococcus marinus]|nr:hypothetical protein [Prochlorococcus marinus]